MRSQQEIIKKINKLRLNKTKSKQADMFDVQIKTLIRKLHWETAREFLPPRTANSQSIRENWHQTSCLDKKFLIGEIGELMYQAYDSVIDFDLKKCLTFCSIFMIFAWLLHDDMLIREIIFKIEAGYGVPANKRKFLFKGLFDLICDNFGLRWQIYCREWEIDVN